MLRLSWCGSEKRNVEITFFSACCVSQVRRKWFYSFRWCLVMTLWRDLIFNPFLFLLWAVIPRKSSWNSNWPECFFSCCKEKKKHKYYSPNSKLLPKLPKRFLCSDHKLLTFWWSYLWKTKFFLIGLKHTTYINIFHNLPRNQNPWIAVA